jgi:hypothetical protein
MWSGVDFSLVDENEVATKLPNFIINPKSMWKKVWDGAMLLLILFLSITVPYRIAF